MDKLQTIPLRPRDRLYAAVTPLLAVLRPPSAFFRHRAATCVPKPAITAARL
ncbi:hypothetical protein ACIBI0_31390 [Microbispora rosea]|uniref:hypothetical protein n=1 Tax=Microbispora rosea TaxID=58117 RepID=UPI0037BC6B5E